MVEIKDVVEEFQKDAKEIQDNIDNENRMGNLIGDVLMDVWQQQKAKRDPKTGKIKENKRKEFKKRSGEKTLKTFLRHELETHCEKKLPVGSTVSPVVGKTDVQAITDILDGFTHDGEDNGLIRSFTDGLYRENFSDRWENYIKSVVDATGNMDPRILFNELTKVKGQKTPYGEAKEDGIVAYHNGKKAAKKQNKLFEASMDKLDPAEAPNPTEYTDRLAKAIAEIQGKMMTPDQFKQMKDNLDQQLTDGKMSQTEVDQSYFNMLKTQLYQQIFGGR